MPSGGEANSRAAVTETCFFNSAHEPVNLMRKSLTESSYLPPAELLSARRSLSSLKTEILLVDVEVRVVLHRVLEDALEDVRVGVDDDGAAGVLLGVLGRAAKCCFRIPDAGDFSK